MALKKRSISLKIKKAQQRAKAMNEIDIRYGKIINYGWELNPLTKSEIDEQIKHCTVLTNDYNNALEIADKKALDLKQAEETLGELYTRVLAGGKSIFGVDSDEVTQLGGTKKSERKKSERNHNYF